MKCIVCDRCKTIIEDPRKCRVITCARPLRIDPDARQCKSPYRGDDPKTNDLLWTKELCSECIDELDAFFESESGGDENGGNTTPDMPEPDMPTPEVPGGDDTGDVGGKDEIESTE